MQNAKRIGLVLFTLLLVRCGGSEVGNPEAVGLRIVGIDSSSARLSARVLSGGITLTEARVVLSEIEFRPISACNSSESSDDLEFEGPYVIDLLKDSSIPDLGEVPIPDGTYCRIELVLKKLESDEVPAGVDATDPIVGNSVRIEGSRGDGTKFTATLEVDTEFKLQSKSVGFAVDNSAGAEQFFIAFDLNAWFAGVDLDAADVTGGEIVISEDENKDLLEELEKNVKLSARLFRDEDGNGDLDEDEQEAEDELAEGEE